MRALLRFSRTVDRLNDGLGAALRWLVLVMVLVGAFNAIARYLTRYTDAQLTSNALYELQWYLFSVVFLMGAAYGLLKDVHVRVDVLYSQLDDRRRAWIDVLGTAVFLLPFSLVMLWFSWPAVRNSWRIREVSPDPGGLPRYPIKMLILVSFGLLVLQGLSEAIKRIDVLRGGSTVLGRGEGPEERPGEIV